VAVVTILPVSSPKRATGKNTLRISEGDRLAYTIREACEALGVGKTTLYRWIGERRIDARMADGRTLIPARSLESFLTGLPPARIRKRPGTEVDPRSAAAVR
jgi:excisionase family DNA binding protein